MEDVLALMEQANARLATVFQRVQEHLLEEGRAATREKALQRHRAKGSVQFLGEAKDAERMIDEEDAEHAREG